MKTKKLKASKKER